MPRKKPSAMMGISVIIFGFEGCSRGGGREVHEPATPEQRLPGSMKPNRPLQMQRQSQRRPANAGRCNFKILAYVHFFANFKVTTYKGFRVLTQDLQPSGHCI